MNTLGVPIYPNERFQLGVASALFRTVRIDAATVNVLTATSRMTKGRRLRKVLLKELVTELDRHWINAHPRMVTYRATTP